MPEAGTDFGWLFRFKLWEYRAKLRRDKPFVFWTSVVLVLVLGGFLAWALIASWF